jgi:hypothetical protein
MIVAAFAAFALLVIAWVALPSPRMEVEAMELAETEAEEATIAA